MFARSGPVAHLVLIVRLAWTGSNGSNDVASSLPRERPPDRRELHLPGFDQLYAHRGRTVPDPSRSGRVGRGPRAAGSMEQEPGSAWSTTPSRRPSCWGDWAV